ncbi:hypothetical protein DPMN_148404 [Dreissena polymorpha]|uniref:Uncharacterized protein n=1 Tax=Dreissena polymorpha TaxID=45954 RepID=A0A9D4FBP1_DREPO|nr:hypothetical protein DPMN_148404 [Dreissena polymorpha]
MKLVSILFLRTWPKEDSGFVEFKPQEPSGTGQRWRRKRDNSPPRQFTHRRQFIP